MPSCRPARTMIVSRSWRPQLCVLLSTLEGGHPYQRKERRSHGPGDRRPAAIAGRGRGARPTWSRLGRRSFLFFLFRSASGRAVRGRPSRRGPPSHARTFPGWISRSRRDTVAMALPQDFNPLAGGTHPAKHRRRRDDDGRCRPVGNAARAAVLLCRRWTLRRGALPLRLSIGSMRNGHFGQSRDVPPPRQAPHSASFGASFEPERRRSAAALTATKPVVLRGDLPQLEDRSPRPRLALSLATAATLSKRNFVFHAFLTDQRSDRGPQALRDVVLRFWTAVLLHISFVFSGPCVSSVTSTPARSVTLRYGPVRDQRPLISIEAADDRLGPAVPLLGRRIGGAHRPHRRRFDSSNRRAVTSS